MQIGSKEYDHIEVYDETGQLIVCISDAEIIEYLNCKAVLCKTDKMFKEKS